MRILIYSHFFAPNIGGVESVVLSLARGLTEIRDAKGACEFEVTLVTQTPAVNFDDGALPFRVVRRPGLLQLWRLIRESDFIHAAGPALAPLVLTRFARKPLVIEHHGYQATCPNGLLFHHPTQSVCSGHFQAGNYLECWNCNSKIEGSFGSLRLLASAFLRRTISRSASKNVAPSNHVAARQGLPHTVVIPHGVADPLNSSGIAALSHTIDTKRFAYVGRLVVEKGVSVLVEAARLLRAEGRDIHILLIGDGPDRARLETQIAASHLESTVRITGFLSGTALQRELCTVGTIVIPTIMEETAGLAALEQMALGRALIVSSVGGLREIVDGAGLTFSPGDPSSLADAMRRILDEPGLASSLGLVARQRILQSFTLNSMVHAHARVYQELRSSQ